MMIKHKNLQNYLSIAIIIILHIGLTLQLDETQKDYRHAVSAFLVEKPLEPSEQDVQTVEQDVADFFWTGSGDGSGPKHPQSVGTKYPNTIIRTATILATVFIDGNFDEFDPLCVVDCDKKTDESGIVESIDGHIPPEDRRYWLLTVVAGLFNKQDFPILEAKLAKLYRIAFLRQQAKHLGINGSNNSTINQTTAEEHVARKKRFISDGFKIMPTKTLNGSEEIRTRRFEINKHVYERQVLRMKRHRVPVKSESSTQSPLNVKLPYEIIYRSDDKSKNKKLKANKNFLQDVNVIIHDAIHGDDEKVASDSNRLDPSIDRTNFSNQTEIIYSVIVNGKPILATTAADDMNFVSTDEVIKIMENDIFLKAEPYLKEPLATPLVPQNMNNESNVMATYVNQNPLLIALTTIAIILFILLLLTLTLYGRSKRRLAMEAKRQSATQALVQKINVDDDINTIRSNSLEDIGVENLAFEKERDSKKENVGMQKKEPPVLNFPLPPANRPSSGSSSTSDSSVYYPKRRYKFNSIQDLLEENDGRDEIYTKLKTSTSKSSIRKESSKVHKHRHRRKYRGDNRVGSLEQINTNSFHSDADMGGGYNDESLMHNEAFNPHVSQYNANKLMTDKTFTIVENEQRKSSKNRMQKAGGAEAINQELLGRVQSADSNSIGSFLSMASIRSFPKCSVPEPLSRVLEPVGVTHLDHSDADYDTLKNYRIMDSQKSLDLDDDDDDDIDRDAQCTQSDGALDPGFVGPIVWELHKKGLDVSSTNSLGSPLRDPHTTRNRFEGLLEGAMKLYGSSSYSNCHSLMNQQDDELGQMPGVIKSREARGKSAATIRLTSRTSGLLSRTDFHPMRPKTADQPDIQLQNPIPTIHAWSSGGGSSAGLVRPMSAGIYHKPNETLNDSIKVDRSRAMSASPIIDAIQEELKRISNDK